MVDAMSGTVRERRRLEIMLAPFGNAVDWRVHMMDTLPARAPQRISSFLHRQLRETARRAQTDLTALARPPRFGHVRVACPKGA